MVVGAENIAPEHSEFEQASDGIGTMEEELITTLSPFDLKGSWRLIRRHEITHLALFFAFSRLGILSSAAQKVQIDTSTDAKPLWSSFRAVRTFWTGV